jgi:hypothetical protein
MMTVNNVLIVLPKGKVPGGIFKNSGFDAKQGHDAFQPPVQAPA